MGPVFSPQLMDLQLSDSNFRRHILLQYLILFQYLKGQVKFKRWDINLCYRWTLNTL